MNIFYGWNNQIYIYKRSDYPKNNFKKTNNYN